MRPETAVRRPSQDIPPISHGLWSLWTMMDRHGFLFAEAVSLLSEAKWHWLALSQGARLGDKTESVPLSRSGLEAASKGALDLLRRACILSDMDRLKPDLDRLENLIFRPTIDVPKNSPETIAHGANNLLSRIQDELSAQHYFHLDEQDVQFYGKDSVFGVDVATKLKDAAYDVKNAGNCLALQQPTACVLHLQRAMESALWPAPGSVDTRLS